MDLHKSPSRPHKSAYLVKLAYLYTMNSYASFTRRNIIDKNVLCSFVICAPEKTPLPFTVNVTNIKLYRC
jgi:hypothetical protein